MYGSPPPPPPPPKDLNRPFQPQQMSSGLLRYRSAPSSLLGEVCEDFLPIRATSPETETETMFARFLSPENGGGHRNDSQFPPPPPPPPSTAALVAETSVGFPSPCDLIYQAQNPVQTLIRQSSSPAGLFNNVENGGYNGVMRRGMMMMNRNRNSSSSSSSSNYSNGEGGGGGSSSRLKSQLSFSSSRQSSLLLSQISEIDENDSPTTTPIGGGYHHHHHPMPSSWEPESNHNHNHNHNNNNFSSPSSGGHGHGPTHNSNLQQNLHGDLGNGLTPHQFSMPKAASSQGQMAAIQKLLQFQDSVPCKIRAKRGCATHPRSIAERARRTRISERMRKLQELVPNMDKQTNTADMLDLAVDYIKNLQKQVKTLSDSRASCTCSSSKQNPY